MAYVIADLKANFTADTTRFDSAMARVRASMSNMRPPAVTVNVNTSNAQRSLSDLAGHATRTADIIRAAFSVDIIGRGFNAAIDIMKGGMIDFNSVLQQSTIAMESMTGSADKAAAHIKELRDFAKQTPFEFQDLTKASVRLQAYGFEVQKVIPLMQAMGDQISAVGGNSDMLLRMTNTFGQMLARGRITGEELRELSHAGVPALQALATHYGKTTAEIKKMVQDGVVPANEAIAAITTEIERRFPNLMQKQIRSFMGAMNNMRDLTNQFLGDSFRPVFDYITEIINKIADALMDPRLEETSKKIAGFLQGIVDGFKEGGDNALIAALGFTTFATAAGVLGFALEVLTPLVWKLINPFTIGVGLIGAFGAAYMTNMNGVRDATDSALAKVGNFFSELSKFSLSVTRGEYDRTSIARMLGIDGTLGVWIDQALVDLIRFKDSISKILSDLSAMLKGHLSWDDFRRNMALSLDQAKIHGERAIDDFKRIGQAIWEAMMPKDDRTKLEASIKSLSDTINNTYMGAVTNAKAASDAWANSINSISQAWQQLDPNLKSLIATVVQTIAIFVALRAAQAFVVTMFLTIVPAVVAAVTNIAFFITTIGRLLLLVGPLGLLQLAFRGLWLAIGGPIGLLTLAISAAVAAWSTNFLGFRDIVANVGGSIASGLVGIVDIVSRFASGIGRVFQEVGPQIGAFLEAIKNRNFELAAQIGSQLGERIAGSFSRGMWDKEPEAATNLRSWLDSLGTTMATTGESIGNMAGNVTGMNFAAGLDAAGGNAIAVANNIASQVSAALSRAFSGPMLGPDDGLMAGWNNPAPQPPKFIPHVAPPAPVNYNSLMGATGATMPGKGGSGRKGKSDEEKEEEKAEKHRDAIYGYAKQLYQLFRAKGVPERNLRQAVAAAMALMEHESGFNEKADSWVSRGYSKNERGIGLFQLDVIAGKLAGMDPAYLMDANRNISAAFNQYLYPAYQAGYRTAPQMYWAPPGIGFNPGADRAKYGQHFQDLQDKWEKQLDLLGKAGFNNDEKMGGKDGGGDPFERGIELISRGTEALKKLTTDYSPADMRLVKPFFQDLTGIVEAMIEASDKMGKLLEGDKAKFLEEFENFAENGVKLIGNGVDAFTKLTELVPPKPEALKNLFENGIDKVVEYVLARVNVVSGELLQGAERFVVAAGDGFALIGKGVEVFTKLSEANIPSVEKLGSFFNLLDVMMGEYVKRVEAFDKKLEEQSVAFLRIATDASMSITKGAEAFTAIWSTPPVAQEKITLFVSRINDMVVAFGEVGTKLDTEMVAGARRFSKAVQDITKGVKEGVEALNALWTMLPVNTGSVAEFVDAIAVMEKEFERGFELIGGLEGNTLRANAAKFAEQTSKVVAPITGGVDALNKLWETTPLNTAGLDVLVRAIVVINDKFAQLADTVQEQAPRSQQFAKAASDVVAPISSGVDALNKLWQVVPPSPDSIDRLTKSLAMIIGAFSNAVIDFGREAPIILQGATSFAKTAQAVVAPITAAVEAFASLQRYRAPREGVVGQIIDQTSALITDFVRRVREMGDDGLVQLQQASKFSETLNAVVGAVKAGAEALEALQQYRPRPVNYKSIFDGIDTMLEMFNERAQNVDPILQSQAMLFAASVKATADAVSSAATSLTAMQDYVSPKASQLKDVGDHMKNVVNQFGDLGEELRDKLPQANEFANASKNSSDAIKSGAEAFEKLDTYIAPSREKIKSLVGAIGVVVSDISEIAAHFQNGAMKLADVGRDADAMGKMLSPLKVAIDLFDELQNYRAPDRDKIKSLVGAVGVVVDDFQKILGGLIERMTPAQKRGVEALNVIVNIVKNAVDAIDQINTTKIPDSAKVGQALTQVFSIAREGLAAFKQIAADGLQQVDTGKLKSQADAVGAIVKFVDDAVKSFSVLHTFRSVDTNIITQVMDGVAFTVAQFNEKIAGLMNQDMLDLGMKNLSGWAGAVEKMVGAVGTAVDAFTKLRDYKAPSPFLIEQIVSDTASAVKLMFEKLKGLVFDKEFANTVNVTGSIINALGSAFGVLTKLQDLFEGKGEKGKVKPYKQTPQQLVDALVGDTIALVNGMFTAMQTLNLDVITQTVSMKLEALTKFGTMLNALTGGASGFFSAFAPKEKPSSTIINYSIKQFIENIPKLLDAFESATSKLDEAKSQRMMQIAVAVGGILDAWSRVLSNASATKGSTVYTTVNTLMEGIKTMMHEMAQLASNAGGSAALQGIKDWIQRVIDLVTGDFAYGAGKSFAQTFAQGVKDGLGDVQQSIDQLGNVIGGQGNKPGGGGIAGSGSGKESNFADSLYARIAKGSAKIFVEQFTEEVKTQLPKASAAFRPSEWRPSGNDSTGLFDPMYVDETNEIDPNKIDNSIDGPVYKRPTFDAKSFNPLKQAQAMRDLFDKMSNAEMWQLGMKVGLMSHMGQYWNLTSYNEKVSPQMKELIWMLYSNWAATGGRMALGPDSPFGDEGALEEKFSKRANGGVVMPGKMSYFAMGDSVEPEPILPLSQLPSIMKQAGVVDKIAQMVEGDQRRQNAAPTVVNIDITQLRGLVIDWVNMEVRKKAR